MAFFKINSWTQRCCRGARPCLKYLAVARDKPSRRRVEQQSPLWYDYVQHTSDYYDEPRKNLHPRTNETDERQQSTRTSATHPLTVNDAEVRKLPALAVYINAQECNRCQNLQTEGVVKYFARVGKGLRLDSSKLVLAEHLSSSKQTSSPNGGSKP